MNYIKKKYLERKGSKSIPFTKYVLFFSDDLNITIWFLNIVLKTSTGSIYYLNDENKLVTDNKIARCSLCELPIK